MWGLRFQKDDAKASISCDATSPLAIMNSEFEARYRYRKTIKVKLNIPIKYLHILFLVKVSINTPPFG